MVALSVRPAGGLQIAEAALVAVVEEGKLILQRRPATKNQLTPAYEDAFTGSLGLIRFLRDAVGNVTELSVRQDRVHDLLKLWTRPERPPPRPAMRSIRYDEEIMDLDDADQWPDATA